MQSENRDVTIVKDKATGEQILEIKVCGKRGVGVLQEYDGAVSPFCACKNAPNQSVPISCFRSITRSNFNRILDDLKPKFDRAGIDARSTACATASYISFRLLEGAHIYQIAKNCRTSVEMIEKYYAVHLKII